jgi:hypothetical protein
MFISISLINFSHRVSVGVAIFKKQNQNTKINRKKRKNEKKRSKA